MHKAKNWNQLSPGLKGSAKVSCEHSGHAAWPAGSDERLEYSAGSVCIPAPTTSPAVLIGNRRSSRVRRGGSQCERQDADYLATSARIPTMYPFRDLVVSGGVMAYCIDLLDAFRYA